MTMLLMPAAPKLDTDLQQRFEPVLYSPFMRQFSAIMQASRSLNAEEHSTASEDEIELCSIRQLARKSATGDLQWPTIPTIVEDLDNVLSSPDACARDIADVVMLDVALTAKLISLVNSAVYSLPREISSIEQAVALLGSDQVRNATLAVSVITSFSKDSSAALDVKSFWKHSLAVAMGARFLGSVLRDCGREAPEAGKLFLAGLMHDIGRVIIAQQLPDHDREIHTAATRTSASRLEAEEAILGIGHATLGADLLRAWNIDADVCEAAATHHHPNLKQPLSCIVHCADVIAHGLGFSPDGHQLPRTSPEVWETMNITNESVRAVGAKLLDEMDLLIATMLA